MRIQIRLLASVCQFKLVIAMMALVISTQTAQAWDHIAENQVFTSPQVVSNKSNVLIKNCTFKNFTANDALRIRDCSNIRIENCTFDNLRVVNVIRVTTTPDVVIADCTITDQIANGNAHYSAIKIGEPEDYVTANVAIRDNTISDVAGNGIATGGSSSVSEYHDCPIPGFRAFRNQISNTGNYSVPGGNSPHHGIYVKAQKSSIYDNIISDCKDGQGISIRSSGWVGRNIITDCEGAGIAYWSQKFASSNQSLTIENNLIVQKKNAYDNAVNILIGPNNHQYFDRFVVRFNTCVRWEPVVARPNINFIGDYADARCYGNLLVNKSASNLSAWRYVYGIQLTAFFDRNFLSQYVSENFVSPQVSDYHLKSNAPAINFASNVAATIPGDDLDRVSRNISTLDPGCYEFVAP